VLTAERQARKTACRPVTGADNTEPVREVMG